MGKLAFVFSGQGAQKPGMGIELAETAVGAAQVFSMAEELRPGTYRQCVQGSAQELAQTVNTQPCLYCVDLAAAQALRERGFVPRAVAGFSLGEIPALAFAGCLDWQDAFRFVMKRGAYMEECAQAHPGAMYAVLKLAEADVEALCSALPGCWPVNYNSPGQVVVACLEERAESLCAKVKEAGGRAVKLAVSGAFHSPLMEEAAQRLEAEFSQLPFTVTSIPVYANTTARPYTDRGLLFRQLKSPVLWRQTVEHLAAEGFDTFVEVGVGKTLQGLIAKTLPEAAVLHVEDRNTLEQALQRLEERMGPDAGE